MKNMSHELVRVAALLAGVFLLTPCANAAVIAYDGFAAGGTADGRATNATAYTTSPASTDGLNNDSLHGQSPVSIGFDDGDAWNADGGTAAATVYFQAQWVGLQYPNFKPNTPGQARFFRSSGTIVESKWAERTVTTSDISAVQWAALLVRFNSAPINTWYQDFVVTLQNGEPGDSTAPYDGAWTPATFGVRRTDGKAFYRTAAGGSKVDVVSATALDPGTHLFLLRFVDRPGTGGNDRYDDVTLWVNPELTADPNDLTGGLAAVSITRSDLGGAMHPLDKIRIAAAVHSGAEIAFDEFIVTDDYQDIYNAAPEMTITNLSSDATYIRSSQPNSNFNASGQIIVGPTGPTTSDILRGLIEVDISALPQESRIVSVALNMTTHSTLAGINNVGAAGALTAFNLYAYDYDINEKSATWNAPDAGGVDVSGGTSGTLLSSTSFDVEVTGQSVVFGDSVALRDAVAAAREDDGFLRFILRTADETVGKHNFARFADDETATLAHRPQLLITYRQRGLRGTVILVN